MSSPAILEPSLLLFNPLPYQGHKQFLDPELLWLLASLRYLYNIKYVKNRENLRLGKKARNISLGFVFFCLCFDYGPEAQRPIFHGGSSRSGDHKILRLKVSADEKRYQDKRKYSL